ncbi:MAG: hypothetical protein L6R39_003110 [Caloplaca ligustica]|nr:MAG: hypothetical protein L6R39_003110 [Caloplaca ligustica]
MSDMTVYASRLGSKLDGAMLSPPRSPDTKINPNTPGSRQWLQGISEGSVPVWDGREEYYKAPFDSDQGINGAEWGRSYMSSMSWDDQMIIQSEQTIPSGLDVNYPYSMRPQSSIQPPLSVVTSESLLDEDREVQGEETDLLSPISVEGGEVSKTAAELRAEKRKMKRFRLTHNQTRFLMSEYARQAHPDAAQRERLSREIPGLSPRQVQVWFQNRRAKLKRLTADDQESMLKSRALPLSFDTTQVLHNAYEASTHTNPSGPSSSFHPSRYEYGTRRPLSTGGFRSAGEATGITSPASLSLSFGDLYLTSGSMSASEIVSPISPTSESSLFFTPPVSHGTSPRMQASSGRMRPASLALPSRTLQSQVAVQQGNDAFDPTGLRHDGQSQQHVQQDFSMGGNIPLGVHATQNISRSADPRVAYIADSHGELQLDPRNGIHNHGLYSPAYFSDTAEYPRRASESDMREGQQHTAPLRPLRSAPLAVPPDFPAIPGFSTSEAGPPAFPSYGPISPLNHPWESAQMILPCHNDHAPTLWDQANLYPSESYRSERDDSTPTREAFEER